MNSIYSKQRLKELKASRLSVKSKIYRSWKAINRNTKCFVGLLLITIIFVLIVSKDTPSSMSITTDAEINAIAEVTSLNELNEVEVAENDASSENEIENESSELEAEISAIETKVTISNQQQILDETNIADEPKDDFDEQKTKASIPEDQELEEVEKDKQQVESKEEQSEDENEANQNNQEDDGESIDHEQEEVAKTITDKPTNPEEELDGKDAVNESNTEQTLDEAAEPISGEPVNPKDDLDEPKTTSSASVDQEQEELGKEEQKAKSSSDKSAKEEQSEDKRDDQNNEEKENESILITPEDKLSEFMKNLEVGWSQPPPKWLTELCPNVVQHFEQFPSFKGENIAHARGTDANYTDIMPFFTSGNASAAVCTLKAAKALAASIDTHLYLSWGSHLGAIRHGQPVPWDDDVDAIMRFDKKDEFLAKCENGMQVFDEPRIDLFCNDGFNAIKVWLQGPELIKYPEDRREWYSPFVDLWMFNISKEGNVQEIWSDGDTDGEQFAMHDYFPTLPYYFGGIYVLGSQSHIVEEYYDVKTCALGPWNHMLEIHVWNPFETRQFNCSVLKQKVAFRLRNQDSWLDVISNGVNEKKLFPQIGATMTVSANISDLYNDLEIDNTISAVSECKNDNLRVIEFNADGGKWWLEAAELMKDADIIILNEMDIGMARSDQQHTTRQMAHYLGMNYAWTLTSENGSDDSDFYGLSGNAFLTKCAISNAMIFRDEDEEKERMAMFGQIIVNERLIVIGSVNELNGHRDQIKEYINSSMAIVAGAKESSFCEEIGLMGKHICSNLEVEEKEQIIKPVITQFGFNITLSDRPIISMNYVL